MNLKIHKMDFLPVQMPERMILSRLGYNHHITGMAERQAERITEDMRAGFEFCEPKAVWTRLNIKSIDDGRIVLENGTVWNSTALARVIKDSHAVWIAAVTVGGRILEEIEHKLQESDGKAALIYDAVGGETADAGMDWLQDYMNKILSRGGEKLTRRRFSPGYSDLELSAQRDIFRILKLGELGLTLTEKMILKPEKSVTALAGIETTIN